MSFSYEELGGWSPSLSPYVHHLCLVFACILGIGASQHFFTLSRPVSITLGCVLCLVVFSILLLPSYNKGPRSTTVSGNMTSPSSAQYKALDVSLGTDSEVSPMQSSGFESGRGYENVSILSPSDHMSIELGEFSLSDDSSPDDSSRRNIIDALNSAFNYSDYDDDEVEVELFLNDDFNGSNTDADTKSFVSFYGRHLPLSESLCTWRMYTIMAIFCIVAGSGILVINNIQAVAGAVHKQPSVFFVTIISLANAGGRVLIGLIADASRDVLSRFQLLAMIALLMGMTQFLLSFGSSLLLYPCLLMTGAMFGATFSNIAAITADVFGSKYVGSNYGFIDLAPTLGSYIFSAGLVALFYPNSTQENIDINDNDDTTDNFCEGSHCFRRPFYVTTSCCLFAALLSHMLHVTSPMKKM